MSIRINLYHFQKVLYIKYPLCESISQNGYMKYFVAIFKTKYLKSCSRENFVINILSK